MPFLHSIPILFILVTSGKSDCTYIDLQVKDVPRDEMESYSGKVRDFKLDQVFYIWRYFSIFGVNDHFQTQEGRKLLRKALKT